jgi:lipid II:glycine glycyltransferase (peptidoglycan interpeptide bridge formation enzyme)
MQPKSVIIRIVGPRAVKLTPVDDAARWDEFVLANGGHLLQSSVWGEFKSQFGWRAERWAWVEQGTVLAGAQVLFRRLLPNMSLAYVPRGPLSSSPGAMTGFLDALRTAARQAGVFLLKVEPNWLRGDQGDSCLSRAGLKLTHETIQPPATVRVDLTRETGAILAGMKSKWRYNIRLAERKGVVVRQGTAADLPAFYELMRITGERDRFTIHPFEYYCRAFELLTVRNAVRLFVAEIQGQALAMIFVTAFGEEAIYLYGASGNKHRNLMPNHALHWSAIQWARARGCARYDLWGIAGDPQSSENREAPPGGGARSAQGQPEEAEPARESPLPASLSQFKQGFGGQVVHFSGSWDYVYRPVPFALYRAARRIRTSAMG